MEELKLYTYIAVFGSFALYFAIAWWARASSTSDFYVAGAGVTPIQNGMAIGADWMSAASFISMAGLIAFLGYGGSVFLNGLDRRICFTGNVACAVYAQAWKVYRSRIYL